MKIKKQVTQNVCLLHTFCTQVSHKKKVKFENLKNYLESTQLVNKINHL